MQQMLKIKVPVKGAVVVKTSGEPAHGLEFSSSAKDAPKFGQARFFG